MSDIIANAQQLLEGVTSGEWQAADSDIFEVNSNRILATVSEYSGLIDDTEEYANALLLGQAKYLAEELSEEEWQYGVVYIGLNHGEQHFQWVENTGDADWDKETLQLLIKRWKKQGQSPKIVRRRVSAPEIIE